MSTPYAFEVTNLSKRFKVPARKQDTLREHVTQFFQTGGHEYFQVLEDVSFGVHQGEFFGIIGHNGSGKSTLLKMLAGIIQQDTGTITTTGAISPFLELGVGFHPELTGRDNIYLNGTILGLTRKEIDHKIDRIIAFAELAPFIDQKLKNYSSGMQVRLAFSVAIHAEKDILLMDEVLAVGDMHFQSKCLEYFLHAKKQGKTVILVGHDLNTIQKYCDRVLLLDHGKQVMVGKPDRVCAEYIKLNMDAHKDDVTTFVEEDTVDEQLPTTQEQGTRPTLTHVRLLDDKGMETTSFATGDTLHVEITLTQGTISGPRHVGVGVYTTEGTYLFSYNTQLDDISVTGEKVTLTIPRLPFLRGEYYANVVLFGEEEQQYFDFKHRAVEFAMYGLGKESRVRGMLSLERNWDISHD